ncbi:MAG: hypothetical protein ACLTZH_09265 [Subdoligranulum sp.]
MLAFWLGADKTRMDAAFRSSGLYRPKWDERRGADTYGNLTLARAIADCREVYDPAAAPAPGPSDADELTALLAPHGTRPANSHPCKTCPRQAPCGIQSGRYRQRPAVPGPVPRQSALQLYPADLDAVGRPHLEAGRDRRRQSPL